MRRRTIRASSWGGGDIQGRNRVHSDGAREWDGVREIDASRSEARRPCCWFGIGASGAQMGTLETRAHISCSMRGEQQQGDDDRDRDLRPPSHG